MYHQLAHNISHPETGWSVAQFIHNFGRADDLNRYNVVRLCRSIARVCGKHLLATHMGRVAEVKQEVLTKPGRFKIIAENVHAKEVVDDDGEHRRSYILCFDPREAQRQRKHREEVVKELEQELARHTDHTTTARWAIDLLASGPYSAICESAHKGASACTAGPFGKQPSVMANGCC